MGKMTKISAPTGPYSQNVRFAKKPNKIRGKRKVRKLPPYMTIPEKDRFFRAIDDVRDKAIFRMLYHHGLRASEIGKLQMSDYRAGSTLELDHIYIHRLKGSISGECGVMPAAALAVRSWLRKRGHLAGILFPSRNGTPISRKTIFDMMRRYCKRADIPPEKAHPHCLKHTCCTHLISDRQESIMYVRKHVGHVNIRNTMIYAELVSEPDAVRARRFRDWK